MERQEFTSLLEEWYLSKVALSSQKGHDYAGDRDILANFKRMHETCALYCIDPSQRTEDVFLFYILLKIDRLCNLLHPRKEPENESLDDTLQDVALYLDLLRAFLDGGGDGQ